MRPREPRVARHRVEFDALGQPIVQDAQGFAHPKIDRSFTPPWPPGLSGASPGFVKTGVKELI